MTNIENEPDECLGSGLFVPIAEINALNDHWTGECPECGQVLKLGYAGSLPIHSSAGTT